MSVEQAIHERWSNYAPLTQLVPADQVYTGAFPGEETPFVTMERVGDSAVQRTSEGTTYETVMLRMDVVHADLTSAKQIAESMYDNFNRANFSWSRGKVLDMKMMNRSESQDDNHAWHVAVDYKIEAWQRA